MRGNEFGAALNGLADNDRSPTKTLIEPSPAVPEYKVRAPTTMPIIQVRTPMDGLIGRVIGDVGSQPDWYNGLDEAMLGNNRRYGVRDLGILQLVHGKAVNLR
jgi:hypothetical protein